MNRSLETLLTGITAFAGGVIAGMLLAPKSGRENREWVASQAGDAKHWVEETGHKIKEESERRVDQVSEGIRKTVKDNLPDLYEATENMVFEEDDDKD
ncbi:MAG: YtxH domain-containing protein [Bacteroidota bacterium]